MEGRGETKEGLRDGCSISVTVVSYRGGGGSMNGGGYQGLSFPLTVVMLLPF
jgi:hypothetical protein